MRVCDCKISHLKNKESVVKKKLPSSLISSSMFLININTCLVFELNECTVRGCYRYLLPLLKLTDTIFF